MPVVSNYNNKKIKGLIKKNKYWFLLSIWGVTVFSIWLLAFYPGLMTPDSLDQWSQAKSFSFSNHHPYIHTLIIALIQRVIYSPAAVAFVQILLAACIPAFFINLLIKNNYKKAPLIGIFLVYTFLPSIGLYNITLWKDIAYTNMLFLITILILQNILKNVHLEDFKVDRASIAKLVLAAGVFGITSLLRHNGIIFLFIIPVSYYLLKIYTLKKSVVLFALCLTFFIFFNNILFGFLHVQKQNFINASVLIHMVAAAFNDGYLPLEEEKVVIEKLVPISNLKGSYTCNTSNNLVYNNPEYNYSILNNDSYMGEFYKTSISIISKNIKQVLANRLCMAYNLFGFSRSVESRFLYSVFSNDPDYVEKNNLPPSTNNFLTETLSKYVTSTSQNRYTYNLFWNIPIYIGLLFLIVILKREKKVTVFVFFALVNLVPLAIGGVGPDFRFVYSVMVFGLFSISFLLEKKKSETPQYLQNTHQG